MGETNRFVIEREMKTGFQVIKKLIEKGEYPEGRPSRVYNKLLFLGILCRFPVVNQNNFLKSVKGKGFSLDFAVESSVSNIVCFEFSTYFAEGVRHRKKMSVDTTDSTENSNYTTVKKWNEFQKDNCEFRDWFNGWLDEIKKFEERNLKILKEKDFLTV